MLEFKLGVIIRDTIRYFTLILCVLVLASINKDFIAKKEDIDMELIQKMFLVRIIENCKIDAYWVRKGIWIECRRTRN